MLVRSFITWMVQSFDFVLSHTSLKQVNCVVCVTICSNFKSNWSYFSSSKMIFMLDLVRSLLLNFPILLQSQIDNIIACY